jgi:hypothetical protein
LKYGFDRIKLFDVLEAWDGFLKKKVNLIACGGTALTLLNLKPSTKDVDFLVPEETEFRYLTATLESTGYSLIEPNSYSWTRGDGTFLFELFPGNRVFTTQLTEPVLKEGNYIPIPVKTKNIAVGILNFYDLIISKIFRGLSVDEDDCIILLKAKGGEINYPRLVKRYMDTIETSPKLLTRQTLVEQLEHFFRRAKEEGVPGTEKITEGI